MDILAAVLILGLTLAVLLWYQTSLVAGCAVFAGVWLVVGLLEPGVFWSLWALIPLAAVLLLLTVPPLRRHLISRPAYRLLQKAMPRLSVTEREAMEAGTTWWEEQLFQGKPDWSEFDTIHLPALTEEEQSFIDNEVEELCHMLDEWEIHRYLKDLPQEAWQFLKDKGFFGLIIPKEYGGREFSPYAQSRVMSKIASRSLTAAVTAMVPNSLGPGELLMKYGTEAQKQRWLPGLARGEEIPCFALTGPEAGSDAGAIPDTGIVCKGTWQGEEVLGLRLNFVKRWITLAPVATVIGLAFRMKDPDGLLGDRTRQDYGITCLLVAADTPGIEIGRRHDPGAPFMNGPIVGKDVFVPLDAIIGGLDMAGKGWRMLIEALGAGRGVSLPSLATASGEIGYRMVGAFARIRRQFNVEIGKFEGVQEATSEIARLAYTLEAMRHLVTQGVATGTPSVLSAMAKYHATEMMRTLINHGMDIGGGRAIQLGPRNFMALPYQNIPIAITVEGANILTRSLMIFGQGAMRCHPFLYQELQTLQVEDKDHAAAVEKFDHLFFRHAGYTLNRTLRAFALGLTGARLAGAPASATPFTRRWYQRIEHFSAALAATADMTLAILGGDLKRRELLSARLGDVHSQMLIACSVLKYFEGQPHSRAEEAHAEIALAHALHKAQEAFLDFYDNFPARVPARLLKILVFPFGRIFRKPDDDLIREVGELIMVETPVRQAFGKFIHLNTDPDDAFGRIESTYQMLLRVEPAWQRYLRADAKGELDGDDIRSKLISAAARGVIGDEDVEPLLDYDARRYDALLTDAFEKEFFAPERTAQEREDQAAAEPAAAEESPGNAGSKRGDREKRAARA